MSSVEKNLETTREMKDSGIAWIGEIPKEWSIAPLKSAIKAIKVIEEDNQNVLSLGVKGVKQRDISKNDGMLASNYLGHQSVFPGQLVFCPRDLDGGLLVGVSKYYGCISNLYMVFDSLKESDNQFIEYLIRGAEVCDYWIQHSYGMRYSYNRSQFLGTSVPLPPLDEQQAIANYLDEKVGKIDKLIEEQNQAIENWKEYKQSLITETVTKGLNPNVEMKDSKIEWIGVIPVEWETRVLKKVSKIVTGNTPPKNDVSNYDNGHIPWIKPEDILENFKIGQTRENLTTKGLLQARLIPKHATIVCCIGNIGKSAFVNYDCTTNQQINSVIFDSKLVHSKYGFYTLVAAREEHIRNSTTTLLSIINKTQQGEINVPIPPLHEQQAIANYLDEKCSKIDQTIEQKQALIKQLEEYKQSLIYECVTGKRCVL